MKTRPMAQRPITMAAEKLMQPYRVTGFASNICSHIVLLAAGVKNLPSKSGTAFWKPDFLRMTITHYQLSKKDINIFYAFLKKLDDTMIMIENEDENRVDFNLSCDNYLNNVMPIFQETFLKVVANNPAFLKAYQAQSAWYFELPEDKNLTGAPTIIANALTSVVNMSYVDKSLFANQVIQMNSNLGDDVAVQITNSL